MTTNEIKPGSTWKNVHTGRTDTVTAVEGDRVRLADELYLYPQGVKREDFEEHWQKAAPGA